MPHKIFSLDTQQGTSVAWPRADGKSGLNLLSRSMPTRPGRALAQKVHYDMLIIDALARACDGIERIAERASFVAQPTNPALENLGPAMRLFHELIKTGIPEARIVFALNHVLTDVEEQAVREYLREAGYEVLSGFLPAKTSYH